MFWRVVNGARSASVAQGVLEQMGGPIRQMDLGHTRNISEHGMASAELGHQGAMYPRVCQFIERKDWDLDLLRILLRCRDGFAVVGLVAKLDLNFLGLGHERISLVVRELALWR